MISRKVSHIFLILFFRFLPLIHVVAGAPLAPALYVFGDSLLDSGNNNILLTLAKANYPPYGKDFPNGTATGRFTNGRTIADFIAEFLGLPYSPPVLSVHAPTVTGLNYASATCGILPETGSSFGKCLNLGNQIDWFQRTIKSDLANHFGKSLANYLSKSIFLIGIGSNDYLNIYSGDSKFNLTQQNAPRKFATLLLGQLSSHLERMYNLGARKMVVLDIGPLGCTPSITKSFPHVGKCLNELNELASKFNNMLPKMLANSTSALPGSIFVTARINWLGNDAISHPSKYGLTDTSSACSKTWNKDTPTCIPLLSPCPNPMQNMFWDDFHLTETAYLAIASRCINATSVCTPFNMEKLVRM